MPVHPLPCALPHQPALPVEGISKERFLELGEQLRVMMASGGYGAPPRARASSLVLTPAPRRSAGHGAVGVGIDAVLAKPFKIDLIVAEVRRLLAAT